MIDNSETKESTMPHALDECRAFDVGISSFAECLMEGPNDCSYALPFGYCFLCQHPRLSEIIRQTEESGTLVSGTA